MKQTPVSQPIEADDEIGFEPIKRLSRDMREAAKKLTPNEVRYLVTLYYQTQENRKAAANQVRSLAATETPSELLDFLRGQSELLETRIKSALDVWTDNHPVGAWLKSLYGVGPVISAGLLAHIDLKKAAVRDGVARTPLASDLWAFAGLANTPWEKGQKRPHNAELKTLCFKAGECFVKFSNHKDCFYGHLYQQRKRIEVAKNETNAFSDQAAAKLEKFKIGKTTEAYKAYSAGKLPPAHIHARARRWAVKIFLAHFYEKMFVFEFKKQAPKPYAIAMLGHGHEIQAPN